jgi:hypothetical protein
MRIVEHLNLKDQDVSIQQNGGTKSRNYAGLIKKIAHFHGCK